MKKRSLTINAILNLTRQAMTIVFPFITFPYVSRILGSSEFGKYNFATSIVSYFSLFAIFGLTNFAVREGARIRENSSDFTKLASQLFSFNLLTTSVAYALLLLITILSPKLNVYFTLIMVQSLSIILTTIGLDWVNTVYEDYLYITIRYLVIQILALIAIFTFVKSPDDTVKYCLIMVLGSYGGNLMNLVYIRKYVKVHFTYKIPFKKFFIPMLILFINSLAVIVYVNSDITILGILKTDSEVGIYSFSSKIYNILKQLINASVVVAVPRLTTTLGRDLVQYKQYLTKILNSLILILFPVAVGMLMLSRSIITIVGGQEYIEGDWSLKILSFSLIFALIASIYTNCMLIIGRQEKKTLVGTSFSAILNVVGNFLLIPFIGINGAALTTVLSELVNLVIQRYFAKKTILSDRLLDKKAVLTASSGVILVLVICFVVNQVLVGETVLMSISRVSLSITLSAILYLCVLIYFKNELILKFWKKVKKS